MPLARFEVAITRPRAICGRRRVAACGALLVPEFATRRKLLTFALHPLALCDLTFAFDLPLGKLLLPFLFFFDELSPIGLQPIPGVFQRLLLAGEVGLLLLNVRHAPREILILH